MLDYINKYQNTYVFSDLLTGNFVKMMMKGVTLSRILESDMVLHPINFNDWPEKSSANDNFLVPYNGSKLTLRYKYPEIFPDQHAKEELERK